MRNITLIKMIPTTQNKSNALFEISPGFVEKYYANSNNANIINHILVIVMLELNTIHAYPCNENAEIKNVDWYFEEPYTDAEDFFSAFYELVIKIKNKRIQTQQRNI
jgi:hypothetical protein